MNDEDCYILSEMSLRSAAFSRRKTLRPSTGGCRMVKERPHQNLRVGSRWLAFRLFAQIASMVESTTKSRLGLSWKGFVSTPGYGRRYRESSALAPRIDHGRQNQFLGASFVNFLSSSFCIRLPFASSSSSLTFPSPGT